MRIPQTDELRRRPLPRTRVNKDWSPQSYPEFSSHWNPYAEAHENYISAIRKDSRKPAAVEKATNAPPSL
jgi:hypothetical protein